MPQKMTATSLQSMGCPVTHAAEMESFGLPHDLVTAWVGASGFTWLGAVTFLRKYTGLVPEFVTAWQGGLQGVVAFGLKHINEVPQIVADFMAIFGAPVPAPGPVVMP
jgi:hypothetical protein